VRKVSSDGQIHIDKGYFNGPMIREEKQAGHYVKRVVNFALQQENINPGQYDIFVLSAAGRENLGQEGKIGFGQIGGKSAGSALYLALLSALTQKPLSCQVAATGSLSLSTKRKK
jgi:predicted ATP-dependent protease